jgi:hypothetical protein
VFQVRQWEEATETMQRRDESIQAASAVFAENRARVWEKRQALDERAKLLESEKGKNVSALPVFHVLARTTCRMKRFECVSIETGCGQGQAAQGPKA